VNNLSLSGQGEPAKTAFVLAGGGSFGAIQVGMMHALAANGDFPDIVVGSSVGALNGAYYAGDPTLEGVLQLERIWRGLRRQDVFPLSLRTLLAFVWRRDFLIPHVGIQKLIDEYMPYRNLEDARLPVHIVTTDVISGNSVVISDGPADQAIIASTAIPGAFAPVRYKDLYLADGAISSNTPIKVAVAKGARRLIVLPTGYACALEKPPIGAVANALHALTLLIAHGQRSGKSRTRHRIFRGAAALPAGGLALRFFPNFRSHRARHPKHRRMARQGRSDDHPHSRRDTRAQPLDGNSLFALAKASRWPPL
jgi:NTE family protein